MEILLILGSYLYGSIPFALVIGKLFYKTDVRNYGSGNLGGTNAGRVLGKGAGLLCIILDALKATVVVLVTGQLCSMLNLSTDIAYVCAVACVFGHCYPIFAKFKGGKAVSTAIGYFIVINPIAACIALLAFIVILKITKYVSLSSIVASCAVLVVTPFLPMALAGKIANLLIISLMVYRHKDNIKRIKNGTETKVSWL